MAIIANDAATMLAEALEKMDGLISDDQMMMEGLKPATLSFSPTDHILSLAEDLRNALISVVPSNRQNLRIPKQTAEFLSSWLKSLLEHNDRDQKSGIKSNGEISRAQIERLEDEKDSLILQVSVLTDQVEAQGEKMRELEFTLEEQRIKAEDLEQELKKETAKSAYFDKEREKLLVEISSLKLATDEPNHSMSSGKESPKTIEEYEKKLAEKDSEIELLKDHIEVLLDEQETLQRTLGDGHASSGLRSQLREKASEVNKLKLQVETLTAVVEDKDNKLKELQGIVSKFKRVEDLVVRAHQRKGSEASQSAATELSLPDSNSVHSSDGILSPVPTSTISDSAVESSSPSPTPHHLHQESYVQAVNNPVTPSLKAVKNPKQANKPLTGIRSSFGKGFFKTKGPKSSSESNISQVERSADGKNGAIPQNKVESQVPQVPHEQTSPESQRKEKKSIGKTINKAFGKLRRTKSLGDGQDNRINLPPLDFKNQNKVERPEYGDQLELPFCNWSTEMIMNWLDDLGLGCYTEGCRQNVSCGEDLIRASGPELDKLLGIRHPLHRKKLQLALQALVSDSPDIMGRLSNHWVLGWLEDIGLPHYKDAFSDACVDGRMLNYLTLDDLQQLKVTNALHHVSIQRAIQCLRFNNFHPNSLKRYPIDESWQKGADVLLWTNGRVVEWLRLVDLAEYAPNLRGNGVHGALMILEPRFTAETLAALLSIPTTKSLLRRHLASHFQSLVGPACYSLKEQAAKLPTFTPLMPDTKQKVIKKSKSLGSLRGKKGVGSELDNYVCPMDFDIPQELKPTVTRSRRKSDEEFSRTRRRDSDELIDSKRPTAIGAFSKELDSLTHMLDHDGHAQKMAAHS